MSYNYPNPASAKYSSAARAAARAGRRVEHQAAAAAARAEMAAARRASYRPKPQTASLLRFTSGADELKYLDTEAEQALSAPTNAAGAEVQPTTGCTGCLSCPAQGNTAQSRIGSKFKVHSLLLKGAIRVQAQDAITAGPAMPTIFCALVQKTQTNAATIVSENVYENLAATAYGNASMQRNMAYIAQYKVLKTWTFQTDPAAVGTDGTDGFRQEQHIPFVLQKKFKTPMPVSCIAGNTTADVANVIDNSLHLIAYATNITGSQPRIMYNCRVRFSG